MARIADSTSHFVVARQHSVSQRFQRQYFYWPPVEPAAVAHGISGQTRTGFPRNRNTRSSSVPLLCVQFRRTSFARRSFSTAAPLTRNSLPPAVLNCDSLSTFKSRLKTHLFTATFRPWGLCGQRYPRQRLHCSVGLTWKVAGRGRSSRGGCL